MYLSLFFPGRILYLVEKKIIGKGEKVLGMGLGAGVVGKIFTYQCVVTNVTS